jgi:uncharacterized protein (DUF2141 family)
MNGKLDTGWLGILTEGYGFSNDVKALLGGLRSLPPALSMTGEPLDPTISLHC